MSATVKEEAKPVRECLLQIGLEKALCAFRDSQNDNDVTFTAHMSSKPADAIDNKTPSDTKTESDRPLQVLYGIFKALLSKDPEAPPAQENRPPNKTH